MNKTEQKQYNAAKTIVKTLEKDMGNIRKLLDDLGYCKVCISDIQTRIESESFQTNEEILEEIGRASDFLVDAEKRLKEASG